MTTPADLLAQCAVLMGEALHEDPPHSNRVAGITDWYPMVGPWCAMAASKAAVAAGLPIKFAYCPTGVGLFKNGTYGTWHPAAETPQPADFVFYDWDGDGVADHVELLQRADTPIHGWTFGGNVDDAYKHLERTLGPQGHVLGYGRPHWDQVAAAPVAPHPAPQGPQAPPFPLPAGSWFGPKAGPVQSVSGWYSHTADLARWQNQMHARGWTISADGHWGPQTDNVCRLFQAQKYLQVDGQVGPRTWAAAWTAQT